VAATIEEVADVLSDPLDLPRWWPSVYLSAEEVAPPGPGGVGQQVRLHTRGWLPYTLRWLLTVSAADYPREFRITASGDLEGSGVWTFAPGRCHVDARFEWRVTATKPVLRYLSILMKPLFAANHRWAMREGQTSLEREIARRRDGRSARATRSGPAAGG
jgi:hypothetical protein